MLDTCAIARRLVDPGIDPNHATAITETRPATRSTVRTA